MQISRALEGEFWRVEELAERIHAETDYRDTPLDMKKVKVWYDSQFNHDDVVVLFALEDARQHKNYMTSSSSQAGFKTIGLGAFFCHTHYWCDVKISSDLMVYVIPERRGSTTAMRIIKAYEQWAIGRGCQEINLGISSGINVERTSKFYYRLDYHPTALKFTKER
tara:strand:+ start:732 stop:1229 length:498 start_codon:yes stop_codon:yes gene_type:complete